VLCLIRNQTETVVQRPTRATPGLETRVEPFHRGVQSPSETLEQRMERPQCRREGILQADVSQAYAQLPQCVEEN